jgi:hypothetical protein
MQAPGNFDNRDIGFDAVSFGFGDQNAAIVSIPGTELRGPD